MSKKSFVAFITCGDPDIETTKEIIRALYHGGVDMIELGIPFSDPTAEGPVIQAANYRALSGGVTTDKIFDMVREIRSEIDIPLLFMTYANVIYSYGTDRFMQTASEIGMNGIILPDVPYEEKNEFAIPAEANGLDYISLIAPTSENRISMIAKEAKGFVYCVSSLGVTGTRSSITTDISAMTELVRSVTDIPVLVGFGISTPKQAHEIALSSDGVIIGSAIIKLVEKYGAQCVPYAYEFAKSIKDAL